LNFFIEQYCDRVELLTRSEKMEEKTAVYALFGLQLTRRQFDKARDVVTHDLCKCSDNDRTKKFCSSCGNQNEIMTRSFQGRWHPNIRQNSSGRPFEIYAGDRKYKIHYICNNASSDGEYYYILYFAPTKCPDTCYTPCSIFYGKYHRAVRCQFKKDMKSIGFWEKDSLGVHLVKEHLDA
jgi:hypothetical protein